MARAICDRGLVGASVLVKVKNIAGTSSYLRTASQLLQRLLLVTKTTMLCRSMSGNTVSRVLARGSLLGLHLGVVPSGYWQKTPSCATLSTENSPFGAPFRHSSSSCCTVEHSLLLLLTQRVFLVHN